MSDTQEYTEQPIPDFTIDFLSDAEVEPPQERTQEDGEEGAASEETNQTETPQQDLPPLIPPARWSQESKDAFHTWPREAQEQILARNKDMEGDYTKKTQELATKERDFTELKQNYTDIDRALNPYIDEIRRAGFTPGQIISQTLAYHDLARKDPHGFIREFITQNGIDPLTLFNNDGQFAQQPMDPYTQQIMQQNQTLQQQFSELQNSIQQQQEAERQQRRSALAEGIEAFRLAEDDQGRRLFPYFDQVEPQMTALIKSGQANDLEDAYHKATRLNDDTFHAMQAAQKQAISRQRTEDEVTKSLNAQRAAASVPGSPMGSNQATDEGSVRDTLSATLAEAGW